MAIVEVARFVRTKSRDQFDDTPGWRAGHEFNGVLHKRVSNDKEFELVVEIDNYGEMIRIHSGSSVERVEMRL